MLRRRITAALTTRRASIECLCFFQGQTGTVLPADRVARLTLSRSPGFFLRLRLTSRVLAQMFLILRIILTTFLVAWAVHPAFYLLSIVMSLNFDLFGFNLPFSLFLCCFGLLHDSCRGLGLIVERPELHLHMRFC